MRRKLLWEGSPSPNSELDARGRKHRDVSAPLPAIIGAEPKKASIGA